MNKAQSIVQDIIKPKLNNLGFFYYREIIDYIEKKHSIDVRDYNRTIDYRNNWVDKRAKELGYDMTLEENREKLWEEYINSREGENEPKQLDFWYWLLDNIFSDEWDNGVYDGCYKEFNINEFIKKAKDRNDNWVIEILTKIKEEFGDKFTAKISWRISYTAKSTG